MIYREDLGWGWKYVPPPNTTCKVCNTLLTGTAPYLCPDCLAPIKARKKAARKERKRGKAGQRTQAFAGVIT